MRAKVTTLVNEQKIWIGWFVFLLFYIIYIV